MNKLGALLIAALAGLAAQGELEQPSAANDLDTLDRCEPSAITVPANQVLSALAAGCSSYCTSSTTTNHCVPVIGCTGVPSASGGSGFVLTVAQVEGARNGMILYSLAAHPVMPQAPNGNTSYRCLQAPWKSTGTQFSAGALNSCDGALSVDFIAFMTSHPAAPGNPLMVGQTFYAQGVFKDPGAPGTLNYSDALSFTMLP